MHESPKLTASERGPRSELARYAFGYSDKKPGPAFWVILALMIAFTILQSFRIDWMAQ